MRFKDMVKRKFHGVARSTTRDDSTGHDPSPNDVDYSRCQWDVFQVIPLKTYKDLFLSLAFTATVSKAQVFDLVCGTYHFAVSIRATFSNGRRNDFIIKVPGHGTQKRWTPEDAYTLEREVETMQLVHSKTQIPIPEIMAWSSKIDNGFGFPYIVMRRLPGKDASEIWFEQPYDPDTAHERLPILRPGKSEGSA